MLGERVALGKVDVDVLRTKSSIGSFIVFSCGPLLIRLAMKMRKAPQMQGFPVAGAGFEPATFGL